MPAGHTSGQVPETQIEMNTTVASSKLIDPVMENNLPRLAGSSKFMAGY
jgi:hypothetical protein